MSQSHQELTVDQTTPIQRPSEKQIKQWASTKRVFLSSTIDDLQEERQATAEAVEGVGSEAVMFETFGARSDDSRQAYKAEVRRSDIYLGILSRRYGVQQPSGYSATHAEYEEARKHRKELLLFQDSTVPKQEREGHLNTWLDELYQVHVLAKYDSPEALAECVRNSLTELAREQITPWVKLGPLVFQATHITQTTERGNTVVHFTTASQDPHITSQLTKLARQPFGQGEMQLTFRRRSVPVKVKEIEETIDPLGSDLFKVSCTSSARPGQQSASSIRMLGGGMSTSSGSYEQKDLIRLALHGIALGESPPADVNSMVQLSAIDFSALYETYGDDERVFSKVMRLLIVEAIHGQGLVDQLIHVEVGRPRHGKVHVSLAGLLTKPYAGASSETVEVEGQVDLQ